MKYDCDGACYLKCLFVAARVAYKKELKRQNTFKMLIWVSDEEEMESMRKKERREVRKDEKIRTEILKHLQMKIYAS